MWDKFSAEGIPKLGESFTLNLPLSMKKAVSTGKEAKSSGEVAAGPLLTESIPFPSIFREQQRKINDYYGLSLFLLTC